jgi:ACS family hexuronate transporter-like MFS transporter
MLAATTTGLILQVSGSYVPVFLWGASAYLLAFVLLHLIEPRFQSIEEP